MTSPAMAAWKEERRATVAHVPDEIDGAHITLREREVLAMIARGLSTAEIAAALFISPETAKNHARHMLAKTAARNRAHLVAMMLAHTDVV